MRVLRVSSRRRFLFSLRGKSNVPGVTEQGGASIRLVIFDMAGTTVHDGGEVPAAFIAALADHDIHVTPERIASVRGASKRQAILELIPDRPDRIADRVQFRDRIYDTFRQKLTDRYATDRVRAVTGSEDVFRWLRRRGVKVALNTGFDRDITALIVNALGWDTSLVDAVVSGDDVVTGRPAPDLIFRAMEATATTSLQSVAVVGDTTLDLEAGTNAGVRWVIGVTSGAHDRTRLEGAPHTHLLESVAQLPTLFG